MASAADYADVVRRFVALPAEKKRVFLDRLAERGVDFRSIPIPADLAGGSLWPLSPAQARLWFLWQLEPESAAYVMPGAVRLRGHLEVDALERALAGLAERHAILRTRFVRSPEGAGMQRVCPPGPVTLVRHDLGFLPTEERETEARRLAEADAGTPFDLENQAPFRAALVRLDEAEHWLLVSLHHIAADGWSLGILIDDFARLYTAAVAGEPACLPDLPIQYGDYAVWQRSWLDAGEGERQLTVWRSLLGQEHPVLILPADRPRPAAPTDRGAIHTAKAGAALVRQVRALAQANHTSLFMVLLAAFLVLLHRLSGQAVVRAGVPVANRSRLEAEGLIGFFVNTLVVPSRWRGRDPFTVVLRRVRDTMLTAQANQDLPFERLVEALQPERSLSHNPLFQVMLNHQHGDGLSCRRPLPGLEMERLPQTSRTTQFDIGLDVIETADALDFTVTYATDLFDADTVARFADHWLHLLADAVAHPGRAVEEMALVEADTRRHLLDVWGRGPVLAVPPLSLHGLFAAQAAWTPDAPAVAWDGGSLSYGDLNRRANRLAHRLRGWGVGPDVPVALMAERSVAMLAGLLAVLKAGGAYVPLDPAYPPERLAYMLADSRAALVLTQEGLAPRLPPGVGRVWYLDHDDGGEGADIPDTDPADVTGPEDLVYIIYTSGSTGRPKGVMLPHRSLVNKVAAVGPRFGIGPGFRSAWFISIAFDMSIEQSLYALAHGGCVVPVSDEVRGTPAAFWDLMVRERVTMIDGVPSFLAGVIDDAPPSWPLPYLVFGGEALGPELNRRIRRSLTVGRVVNLYGPTEIGIDAVGCDVPDDVDGAMPIGTPLPNYRVHILDAGLEPVPVGVVGELYIGGAGLARGYLNRPGLTAARFVPDPFGGDGGRLYRTGDLGRWRADGTIDYLGRIDHQVKIRGFRIELGEIEARLGTHPAVRDAAVVVRSGSLAGYVVADAAPGLEDALRAHLDAALPDYMVPPRIVVLDRLPLTANGKLDRESLPEPEQTAAVRVEPRTETERRLAALWADVLGRGAVGVTENFFELGGDSIIAIQVVSRARRAGLAVSPKDLFRHQTVEALARALPAGTVTDAVPVEPETGPVPLTPIQRDFFDLPLGNRSHWNQCVALRSAGPLPAAALGDVTAHHAAFSLRYRRGGDGAWEQSTGEPPPGPLVWDRTAADESEVEALCEAVQRSLDIGAGPLLRVLSVGLPDGGGLLVLVIHHLVVDGVSWRVLLEDLAGAYAARLSGRAPVLAPRTTGFAVWARRLAAHAAAGGFAAETAYWTGQLDPAGVVDPPRDGPGDGPGLVRDQGVAVTRLGPAVTAQLLGPAGSAYRTRGNELLLTALARVLCRWADTAAVLVEVEGHGREDLFPEVDVSRTVGWFTSLHPLRLAPGAGEMAASVKAVKEQVRGVPGGGIGYGVLRHLVPGGLPDGLAQPRVTFNYLGRFDGLGGEDAPFVPVEGVGGSPRDPDGPLGNWLEINGRVYGGELRFDWSYSRAVYRNDTVAGLAAAYEAELAALAAHCLSPDAGGLTPADVPLAGLDQETLDHLPALAGVAARDMADVYPLSPMQQGMLFHQLHSPEAGLYVDQMSVEVEGLDAARLTAAWAAVLERHEALRSGFLWGGGLAQPLQVVWRRVPPRVVEVDRRADPPGEDGLAELAAAERAAGFDVACPPLQRVLLVRVAADRHRLIWTHHHLITDGWSTARQLGEVLACYRGAALPPVSGRYRDHIAWLAGRDAAADEAFWRTRLAVLAEPALVAGALGGRGDGAGHGEVELRLPAARTRALRGLAQGLRVTLNTVVQGAWLVVVHRLTGQGVVCAGATVAGRPASLAGAEETLGLFINTLPMTAAVRGGDRVGAWLAGLQADALVLREHEHTPLYEIQRWAGRGGQALFDSLLVFENYPVDEALRQAASGLGAGGLRFGPVSGVETTNYALTLLVSAGEELAVRFSHRRDALAAERVALVRTALERVLEGLAAGGAETRLGDLAILGAAERHRVVEAWGRGPVHAVPGGCVHDAVSAQAARTPGAVAVVADGGTLTYGELEERSNRLAHRLRAVGVGVETVVGIAVERSAALVVGLLGILKAGGAYLPLDPSYPEERLGFMLADGGAGLVLTTAALAAGLPVSGARLWCLDRDWAETEAYPATPPATGAGADNLAYVIHTSGSTGKPKGVMITHGNLMNFLETMADRPGIAAGDRVLGLTSLSFDIAGLEIYLPLLAGARVVMAGREAARDGAALARTVAEHGVTMVQATPSSWRMLEEDGTLPPVTALCGGEALPDDLARRLVERHGGVWNLYGPTETTIWSTRHRIGVERPEPLLGFPIGNTTIHVLDEHLDPVPPGVAGELYIGGLGVARGYRDRPALTAERFVPDPFDGGGGRLYRTGDMARRRDDGTIEYLGRTDHQVKIRGHRIELGEIDARLEQHPAVRAAVTVARPGLQGLCLVSYVTTTAAGCVEEALRAHVQAALPDYMVPMRVVVLDRLPQTPNGKIDRKALPEPGWDTAARIEPRTPTERVLAAVWGRVLGLEAVGVTDNFFELGGHSLLALRVAAAVREAGLARLSVADIFHHTTIERLAARIDGGAGSGMPSFVVPLRPTSAAGVRAGLPAVYCLPTFFGKVGGYLNLVRALDTDHAVTGLQARWLDDPWMLDGSVEEIAGAYADHIATQDRAAQDRAGAGCCLLGWSWGGVLAYEVARQLAGRVTVHVVGMIDIHDLSGEFDRFARPITAERHAALAAAFADWIAVSPLGDLWRRLLAKASDHERTVALNYFLERKPLWETGGEEDGISVDSPEYIDIVLLNTIIITRRYRFVPHDVPIRSWVAAESLSAGKGLIDWGRLSQHSRVEAVIDGVTHDTIIDSPMVFRGVCETLRRVSRLERRASNLRHVAPGGR